MDKYKDYSFRELQIAAKKKGLTADGNRKELIAKLEGKKLDKTPDLNDRIDRLEAMILSVVKAQNSKIPQVEDEPRMAFSDDDFEEDYIEEEEEKEEIKKVEPKVFQAGSDERIKESHITGGAPEGMLLNDFLIKKGISFNELNNILKTYIGKVDTNDTVRVTTLDDVEKQIQDGMVRAREIEKSNKTRVEITKDIHLVDALKKLGWHSIGISGRTHILER